MLKIADWVTTKSGGKGIVKRIAKDGSWADVNWGKWSKRMKPEHLIIQTSIQVGDWTVTDMMREQEVGESK